MYCFLEWISPIGVAPRIPKRYFYEIIAKPTIRPSYALFRIKPDDLEDRYILRKIDQALHNLLVKSENSEVVIPLMRDTILTFLQIRYNKRTSVVSIDEFSDAIKALLDRYLREEAEGKYISAKAVRNGGTFREGSFYWITDFDEEAGSISFIGEYKCLDIVSLHYFDITTDELKNHFSKYE